MSSQESVDSFDARLGRTVVQLLGLIPTLGTILILVGGISFASKVANAGLPWMVSLDSVSIRQLLLEGALLLGFAAVAFIVLSVLLIAFKPEFVCSPPESSEPHSEGHRNEPIRKDAASESKSRNGKTGRCWLLRLHPIANVLAALVLFIPILALPVGIVLGLVFFASAMTLFMGYFYSREGTEQRKEGDDGEKRDGSTPWVTLAVYLLLGLVGVGLFLSNVSSVYFDKGQIVSPSTTAETVKNTELDFGVISSVSGSATIVYKNPKNDSGYVVRTVPSEGIEVTSNKFEIDERTNPSLLDWIGRIEP